MVGRKTLCPDFDRWSNLNAELLCDNPLAGHDTCKQNTDIDSLEELMTACVAASYLVVSRGSTSSCASSIGESSSTVENAGFSPGAPPGCRMGFLPDHGLPLLLELLLILALKESKVA